MSSLLDVTGGEGGSGQLRVHRDRPFRQLTQQEGVHQVRLLEM